MGTASSSGSRIATVMCRRSHPAPQPRPRVVAVKTAASDAVYQPAMELTALVLIAILGVLDCRPMSIVHWALRLANLLKPALYSSLSILLDSTPDFFAGLR